MNSEVDQAITTLRLRITDRHPKALLGLPRSVNFVWNFCQQSSLQILERECRFCTGYDLDKLTYKLTSGASKAGLSRACPGTGPAVPNRSSHQRRILTAPGASNSSAPSWAGRRKALRGRVSGITVSSGP